MHRTDDARDPTDARLDDILRYALAIGAVLVLLLPAARGFNATVGWLPLWLLAMPLTARWALRGARLSRQMATMAGGVARGLRQRRRPQARRQPRAIPRRTLSRAA